MASIELHHIQAAFALAAEVFEGSCTFEQAAARLQQDHDLNINSARDFLGQYRCMLTGEVYKRTQSSLALSYFLPKILETKGRVAAENAVSATWKHIAYYEQIEKTHLNKLRKVLTSFEASLPGALSQQVHASKFEVAVADAKRDSSVARQARLANALKKPEQVQATCTVYRRNQDVVAEVLLRAKGMCEVCGKPAPFKRRTDDSPYLEVHHKVQLAHGGDDTVENALAVCPNCHRQAHCG
jgi:5-methylcytosine-specific restriction protein A